MGRSAAIIAGEWFVSLPTGVETLVSDIPLSTAPDGTFAIRGDCTVSCRQSQQVHKLNIQLYQEPILCVKNNSNLYLILR
jgi:hypothetical protein